MLEVYAPRELTPEEIFEHLGDVMEKYNPDFIVVEPPNGNQLIYMFRRRDIILNIYDDEYVEEGSTRDIRYKVRKLWVADCTTCPLFSTECSFELPCARCIGKEIQAPVLPTNKKKLKEVLGDIAKTPELKDWIETVSILPDEYVVLVT